ncbi:MAG: sortase [Intestinimonas sp.]|jgi:sortase A|nr:sortase [Intestinimonas sp.]
MKDKRGMFLMAAGCLCLTGALVLMAFNALEEQHADRVAEATVEVLTQQVIPQQQPTTSGGETTATEIQSVKIDGDDYIGVLDIPSLELSLPVMGSWSDSALKNSPCRYAGSYLSDDMIIAGHNYRRQFGALGRLETGDAVTFTDVDGYVCRYKVVALETLAGTDVEGMTSGDWDLTLFTCTYGGRSRITVRCQK